jgi:hypothetical protein
VFGYYARQASNESISHEASFWIQEASFWTIQWLMVSWILLAFFAGLAFLLGAITWRRAPEKAKARAAVRTSRFALALPSFLFVLSLHLVGLVCFPLAKRLMIPSLRKRFFHMRTGSHVMHAHDG